MSNFETFVASTNYTINWQNGGSSGSTSVAWGSGNDNLGFDGEGNLWVLQDGGNNYVWMVKPTHTSASPQVSLFMTPPSGSEPTGITFTPDYKFMFLSFQHPSSGNTGTLTDAAGQSITFNKGTTLVVARAEHLGAPLALELADFQAIADGDGNILLEWTVGFSSSPGITEVQLSLDGRHFSTVKTLPGLTQSGTFYDTIREVGTGCHYVRLKFTEADGSVTVSPVRAVCPGMKGEVRIFPNPVGAGQAVEVECDFEVKFASLFNLEGRQVFLKNFAEPMQKFRLEAEIAALSPGIYFLELRALTCLQSCLYPPPQFQKRQMLVVK